jgi:hypothetical protein
VDVQVLPSQKEQFVSRVVAVVHQSACKLEILPVIVLFVVPLTVLTQLELVDLVVPLVLQTTVHVE